MLLSVSASFSVNTTRATWGSSRRHRKTLPNGLMTHFIGGICSFTHGLAGHFLWSFFPSVRLFRFYILGGWILQMGCWTRSLCEPLSAFAPCGFPFFGRLVLFFFSIIYGKLGFLPADRCDLGEGCYSFSFLFLVYGWLSILHGCRASPRLFSFTVSFFWSFRGWQPPLIPHNNFEPFYYHSFSTYNASSYLIVRFPLFYIPDNKHPSKKVVLVH
ncbi:hypothetical protein V8F33_011479 [Rhypophila sp. PSN 637]